MNSHDERQPLKGRVGFGVRRAFSLFYPDYVSADSFFPDEIARYLEDDNVVSSGLPGTRTGRATPRPCLALLRVGFAMRRPSPDARCALTAPFHPCLCLAVKRGHRRSALCCTFRRLTAPGRYPAPCPVELGLSSDGASGKSRRPAAILTRVLARRYPAAEGRVPEASPARSRSGQPQPLA